MSASALATAIVLAGGQSRRMGQDKALLQLQGEALLTRTCRLAQAVSLHTLVITARSDYQPLLPQGCELLLEAEPQGPLQAFAYGLEQSSQGDDDWLLLLACDLPLLTPADLEGAIAGQASGGIAHLPNLPTEIDAYLPPAGMGKRVTPKGPQKKIDWEPLCGFYRRRCLSSLKASLHQGNRSFQRWLPALKISPLLHWPAAHLLNCNHPQDWEQVLKHLGEPN